MEQDDRLFTTVKGGNLNGYVETDRTIVHESGHALVAWLSPSVISVDEMRLYDGGGGRTAYRSFLLEPAHYWEKIAISLAGMAAEILYFNAVRSLNSRGDLTEARDLADELCRNGRPRLPWVQEPAVKDLEFVKMFHAKPSDEAVWTMNESFKRAAYLIRDNKAGHDRLVEALRRDRVLSAKQISSLFGPRLWAPIKR